MPARDYRDRIVWKTSFELAIAIYTKTSYFPKEARYELTSQLRRAGVSIPSNIAEGEGRNSKEFLRYLSIALGSVKELETQILISEQLGYLRQGQMTSLMNMAAEVGRLIHGLSRALQER
jgi:four helix bundle protein